MPHETHEDDGMVCDPKEGCGAVQVLRAEMNGKLDTISVQTREVHETVTWLHRTFVAMLITAGLGLVLALVGLLLNVAQRSAATAAAQTPAARTVATP